MLNPLEPRWRLVTTFRSMREPLVALTIGGLASWFAVSGSVAYDNAGTVFCKWPYAGGSSLLYVLHQHDPCLSSHRRIRHSLQRCSKQLDQYCDAGILPANDLLARPALLGSTATYWQWALRSH